MNNAHTLLDVIFYTCDNPSIYAATVNSITIFHTRCCKGEGPHWHTHLFNQGGGYYKRPFSFFHLPYIDGLVLERRNSSASAMELRLSCTNPTHRYDRDIDIYKPQTYTISFIILSAYFIGIFGEDFSPGCCRIKCLSLSLPFQSHGTW